MVNYHKIFLFVGVGIVALVMGLLLWRGVKAMLIEEEPSNTHQRPHPYPPLKTLESQDVDALYIIYEYPHFLSDEECDELISKASKKLEPSNVYTENSDLPLTKYRESKQAWMKEGENPLADRIGHFAAQLTGTNFENQEEMQIVQYDVGGFFLPHYDPCYGDKEFCKRMNKNGGARFWTFMIYLNDDYEGGHTIFPKIEKKVKPAKGKLVVFQNTYSDNEEVIAESLHGGEKVTEGKKWICNKWIRHRKYRTPKVTKN